MNGTHLWKQPRHLSSPAWHTWIFTSQIDLFRQIVSVSISSRIDRSAGNLHYSTTSPPAYRERLCDQSNTMYEWVPHWFAKLVCFFNHELLAIHYHVTSTHTVLNSAEENLHCSAIVRVKAERTVYTVLSIMLWQQFLFRLKNVHTPVIVYINKVWEQGRFVVCGRTNNTKIKRQ